VIIALTTMAILLGVAILLAHSAYNSFSKSENAIPSEIFSDGFGALFDEAKVRHLTRSELALAEALEASTKNHYDKAHSSFDTAVDEMSEAVGGNSGLTCLLITMQATEEQRYKKWSVVEALERRLLKALPKTKSYKQMIAMNTTMLTTALEQQGKYDEALQLHEEALTLAEKEDASPDKENVRSELYKLSRLYEDFQVYDKAFETKERLVSLSQKLQANSYDEASHGMEWLLADEAGIKSKAHEFKQSIALYDKAIALAPKAPALYSDRGYMYKHDLHDFTAAISDYTKAIDICKAEETASADLKSSDVKSSDVKSSDVKSSDVKSSDVKPDDVKSKDRKLKRRRARTAVYFYYFRRAVAYMEMKQYDKALADISIASAEQPEYAFLYARRGEIYSRMGKVDQALSDFDKALKLSQKEEEGYHYQPNSSDNQAFIYLLRGDAYRRAERYKEALADYEQCALLAPKDVRSFTNRAAMLEQLRQHQKALADYTEAEKCLAQYAPKHLVKDTIESMPEWKERMAVDLYDGRAKVYDALKNKKLADADRAKVAQLQATIQSVLNSVSNATAK
jgi:tetratricopeptide (TPR) repeat protein